MTVLEWILIGALVVVGIIAAGAIGMLIMVGKTAGGLLEGFLKAK